MPGWGWAVLVVFMIVAVALGLIHAFRRFRHFGFIGAALGNAMGTRFDRMASASAPKRTSEPPLFTQPLDVAQQRYERAYAKKLERQDRAHARHRATWLQWLDFNK